ncbi:phosphatidic acid phosphatase type 2/haloperoxidase [Schizophyllum amplum]|uniref:Phosphatidic acid phosphatase type 2/haloperoxidase n=1 Tax=Schizophyllum amplum TaxID=97359 RepID=A0A550CAX8_9AGAR|nr:phosphatidic acid phosphatase type 2/haloperoxidase [Auriculariopsis ampla]
MSYFRLREPLMSSSTILDKIIPARSKRDRRPAVTKERRRKLLLSYLPDWLLTIVLAALFFALDEIEGFKRVFSLEDTSLRHPYAVHERIPNKELLLIAILAPVVLLPIVNLFTIRSWWDLHSSWLGVVLGLSLTGAVTQFAKVTVGRPRPDVIDRCQPIPGSVDPTYGLSNYTICTQENAKVLRDGFRSFPSGHSSLSFAGLGFLAFYLAGKLHLFDKRGHAGKAWVALTPFAGAALVAISRTMDYRHHWHDVLVGSILGTVMAFFAYRQYYPSLADPLSHRPYSPRVRREGDADWVEGVDGSAGPEYGRAGAGDSLEGEILPTHRYNASYTGGYPPPPAHVAAPRREYDDPYGAGPSGMHRGETMKRPGPGPLEDVWRQGEEEDEDEDEVGGRDRQPLRDGSAPRDGLPPREVLPPSDSPPRPRGVQLEDNGPAREVPMGMR